MAQILLWEFVTGWTFILLAFRRITFIPNFIYFFIASGTAGRFYQSGINSNSFINSENLRIKLAKDFRVLPGYKFKQILTIFKYKIIWMKNRTLLNPHSIICNGVNLIHGLFIKSFSESWEGWMIRRRFAEREAEEFFKRQFVVDPVTNSNYGYHFIRIYMVI